MHRSRPPPPRPPHLQLGIPAFAAPRGPECDSGADPADEFRMAPQEVAASVAPSGLTLEQVIELPPFHYGVTFYKPAVLSGVG